MRKTIVLDLTADGRMGKDLVATGGVFAGGATVQLDDECNLVLQAGQEELRLVARVVLVNEAGAGLEVLGRSAELRDQIEAFVRIAAYIAVMRDEPAARARSQQDTIPAMPPKVDRAAAPLAKGGIIERVRNVRYGGEQDDARDELAGRTRTLLGAMADHARRKPASSGAPESERRIAIGSIAPATEPAPPRAPVVAPEAAPAGKRKTELAIGHAPTQDAVSLESKALDAQIAAKHDEKRR
jgi:hypothetical protein